MKNDIKTLNNTAVTDIKYQSCIRTLVKTLRETIDISNPDDDSTIIKKLYDEIGMDSSGQYSVTFEICECQSKIHSLSDILVIIETCGLNQDYKFMSLSEFKLRNENKYMRKLSRIRSLSWREADERARLIEDFRTKYLPLIIEDTSDDMINTIRIFEAIAKANIINIEIDNYNTKVSNLIRNNSTAAKCRTLLNDLPGDAMEDDLPYGYLVIEDNNGCCYTELNISLHLDFCNVMSNRPGNVEYDASGIYSDCGLPKSPLFNNDAISILTNLMDNQISAISTLPCSWEIVTKPFLDGVPDEQMMISVNEVCSRIEKQLFLIETNIDSFYQKMEIVLTLAKADLLDAKRRGV